MAETAALVEMSIAVDAHLERKSPKTVFGTGERTHRGFDDLAWAAKGGASNA